VIGGAIIELTRGKQYMEIPSKATIVAESSAKKEVDSVMKIDAERRYAGVREGLTPLSDLALKPWDYSYPTLELDCTSSYAEIKVATLEEYVESFYSIYDELDGVSLEGLLVAGGGAGQFVRRRGGKQTWQAEDVDVFVYGFKTVKEAQARVARFIADLEVTSNKTRIRKALDRLYEKKALVLGRPQVMTANEDAVYGPRGILDVLSEAAHTDNISLKSTDYDLVMLRPQFRITEEDWETLLKETGGPISVDTADVTAIRAEGSLTITYANGLKIQVIFRLYSSPSEILHGFDMGAAAVGFDGKEVWFTELGRLAYGYGLTVLDPSRRSPTYEARLTKYMRRGFSLVARELDLADARSSPCTKYKVPGVLDLPHLPVLYNGVEGNRVRVEKVLRSFGCASDYGPEGEFCQENEDGAEYQAAYANLYRLLRGRKDFVHVIADEPLCAVVGVLSKPPHLTVDMINSLYDGIRSSAWERGRLNVRTLHRYVPEADLGALIALSLGPAPEMRQALDAAFDRQREKTIRAWTAIADGEFSIPWITENPGKQGLLSGSRTPEPTTVAEWYGPFCAK
jgi:hypothetical protein